MALVLLLLCGGSRPVQAVNRSLTFDTLGLESDVSVAAPQSSVTFEFPVPRLARILSATANLTITPNQQLNGDNIVFIYYNDELVETRTVKDIRQRKTFSVKLPVNGQFRDSVRLAIRSSMFITDNVCRDYYSGGLFFTVHNNSNLNLTYDMLPVRTVADFFGSFQESLFIVAPNDSDLVETSPAALTYGLLRKVYPNLKIQLVRASELAKLPPAPRLWVGLTSKLPDYFKNMAPGIALADSNTLLISAANVEELRTNVRQLADLPIFSLNPTASKRILITPVDTSAGKATEAISFGNQSAQEGRVIVPADFTLHPALLDRTPERLGFHLEGSYTVAIDSSRPVRMDVFLNNNLVYSSVMEQSGYFKRDVALPAQLELQTRNNLSIQFNYPEEPGQCRAQGKIQSAQIFPTSYMWGAGQYKAEQLSWTNIGLFFGQPGTVLVDENLGANQLQAAGEIAYFLNRQLPAGSFAFPQYHPLSQLSTAPAGQYQIVAGITEMIPQSLQEKMPVTLGKDFTLYRKNNQATRFEYQSNVNTVVGRIGETGSGPLVIFSVNQDGPLLLEALRHIALAKNYDSLTGNILVYRQPIRLYSFDVRTKIVKIEKPAMQGIAVQLWEDNKRLITMIASILAAIVVFLFFFRVLFPRKKIVANSKAAPIETAKKTEPVSGQNPVDK